MASQQKASQASGDQPQDGSAAGASNTRPAAADGPREVNAIYQKNQVVARVNGAEVNLGSKEIHFDEIDNSDDLLLPDECEFREYRILVKKIGYATKVAKNSLEKGRILEDVKAIILGDRQAW